MPYNSGTLYIVATPIGNLSDITLRALEVLQTVDLIAAEDTRHSSTLLAHFGIKTPMISLHEYNENKRSELIIAKLIVGKNIALISDAGTPLISDPGYHLVKKVRAKSLHVVAIPGPSAVIAALSIAGLPTEKFIFEGFLPVKDVALGNRLKELVDETRTIILYEAPHRLMQLINKMLEVFGEAREITLVKELTKVHETVFSASLMALKLWLEEDPRRQKGEFVILISGAKSTIETTITAATKKILQLLLEELPPKKAVNLTAKITGSDKKNLYQIAIGAKQPND